MPLVRVSYLHLGWQTEVFLDHIRVGKNYSPCETVLHLLTSAVSDQRMPSHAYIDTQYEGLGCCVDDSTYTMSSEEGQNKVARF